VNAHFNSEGNLVITVRRMDVQRMFDEDFDPVTNSEMTEAMEWARSEVHQYQEFRMGRVFEHIVNQRNLRDDDPEQT